MKLIFIIIVVFFSTSIKANNQFCYYTSLGLEDFLFNKQNKNENLHSSIIYKLNEGFKLPIFEMVIFFDQSESITIKSIKLLNNSYGFLNDLLALSRMHIHDKIIISIFLNTKLKKYFEYKNKNGKIERNFDKFADFILSEEFTFNIFKEILISNFEPVFEAIFNEQEAYLYFFKDLKKQSNSNIIKVIQKSISKQRKFSEEESEIADKKKLLTVENLINTNLKKFNLKLNSKENDYEKFKYYTLMPGGSVESNYSSHHPDFTEFILQDINKISKSFKLPTLNIEFFKDAKLAKEIIKSNKADKMWASIVYIESYHNWNEGVDYNIITSIRGYCLPTKIL